MTGGFFFVCHPLSHPTGLHNAHGAYSCDQSLRTESSSTTTTATATTEADGPPTTRTMRHSISLIGMGRPAPLLSVIVCQCVCFCGAVAGFGWLVWLVEYAEGEAWSTCTRLEVWRLRMAQHGAVEGLQTHGETHRSCECAVVAVERRELFREFAACHNANNESRNTRERGGGGRRTDNMPNA